MFHDLIFMITVRLACYGNSQCQNRLHIYFDQFKIKVLLTAHNTRIIRGSIIFTDIVILTRITKEISNGGNYRGIFQFCIRNSL